MRRCFLALLALAAFAPLGAAAEKTNIVLIFSDDHAYQAVSAVIARGEAKDLSAIITQSLKEMAA